MILPPRRAGYFHGFPGAERRIAAIPNLRLVVLSNADKHALEQSIGDVDIDIHTLLPGMPPNSLSLPLEASFKGKLVLDGTYNWWMKRRDLERFLKDWKRRGTGEDLIVRGSPHGDVSGELPAKPWSEAVSAQSVDVGLITDRFVAGFKLKALSYIAINCAVFSFCDIRSEFAGIPHADIFVRLIRDIPDLIEQRQKLAEIPRERLLDMFEMFRQGCIGRFNWSRSIESALFSSRAR